MKRPLVVEPVAGSRGRSLIGLGEREVTARTNPSTVLPSVLSELCIDKLALAQDEYCWLRCRVN